MVRNNSEKVIVSFLGEASNPDEFILNSLLQILAIKIGHARRNEILLMLP